MAKAKELWKLLKNKYKLEEVSNQKFLILNYFDNKMTSNKSVFTQVHELQLIVGDLKSIGIDLSEDFQVGGNYSQSAFFLKEL